MVMRAVVFLALLVASPQPAPPKMVTVHGAVLDYAGRPVAAAAVRGSLGERSVSVETRSDGHFDIIVGARTHVTASQGDMSGSVKVGAELDQTVVIKMAQMPM
jgi:hypothetical protein